MTRSRRRGPQGLSRREFLALSALGAGSIALPAGCDFGTASVSGWPFRLGVASGDPLPDRVVLWTRLAPEPLAPDGRGGMPPEPIEVVWEVAHDEGFRSLARSGFAIADPSLAHSVHVDVNGLEPDRWYYYRFWAGGYVSEVGRTRTFPHPGEAPALVRFASASCQDFKDGFYTSHAALAQEDIDFVVFLGDYIYESGVSGDVRDHDGPQIADVAGYRNRYALYRSDANLRAAHQNFPWITTWDDHEVSNNYAGLLPQEGRPDRVPPTGFEKLRNDAYRVWWEHMPVRLLPPKTTAFPIFRGFDYGDLLRIQVLDTRQQRTRQECGGEAPGPVCAEFPSAEGEMLGADQERWLFERLLASDARWNVLAQQVVFSPTPIGSMLNFDQWDGYPIARQRILDFLAQVQIRNPVVLSGDVHAAGIGFTPRQALDFSSAPLASEFVATGLSSGGLDPALVDIAELLIGSLPQIQFFDGVRRGYLRHVVTRDRWQADLRFVDSVLVPTSAVSTGASFVVEDGTPEPQPG